MTLAPALRLYSDSRFAIRALARMSGGGMARPHNRFRTVPEGRMPLLTLCIPSNRSLERSLATISDALSFAEERDALVLVSDNSGLPEKAAHWWGKSPRLIYHTSTGTNAFENILAATRLAETPFIMLIGDDDRLASDPKVKPYDLADLPPDYMGIRPKTLLEVTGLGVVRTKEFGIVSERSSQRILEYARAAGGDNSGFYSIFRREHYVGLLSLFLDHHPIKGAFIDWAFALALFAYGRMAYDPSILFRYNADQWATVELTDKKNQEIFAACGLPPHTTIYQPLLMALDVFCFVCRPGTPLNRDSALDAASIVAGDLMNTFLNQVTLDPTDYSERMRYLVELARAEDQAFARFQLGLMMVDELRPGLKDGYLHFFKVASGSA